MKQAVGARGKGAVVKSKSNMKQKITIDLVDIEKGVYVDKKGVSLGLVPKELLNKCREAGKNED